MRPVIHGGDIYQNEIELDFSVNINPFGIPEKVKEAMQESLELCEHYPDIHHAKLIEKIGAHYHGRRKSRAVVGHRHVLGVRLFFR